MGHSPFATALEGITAAASTSASFVTDGAFTCTYTEIPGFIEQIVQLLDEGGTGQPSCPIVECPNTLAGALLCLALMKNGTSFVLIPPAQGGTDLKPAPNFCDYRLVVSQNAPTRDAFAPRAYLRKELNPGYNGRPVDRGRLYLRTSGSMGVSKIVAHTHDRLIGNARNVARKYGFSAQSRAAIPVPVAHMYGFGAEFLPAILTGASIDLQERTNLLKYLDREKRFQPTIVFATPAVCEMLKAGYKTPRTQYEVFVTSGQRITEELFRAFDPFVGGRLINQYGSTEMGAISACDPSDNIELRATTIGRPLDGVNLRLDPLASAEPEQKGTQLYCRHPYGFEGYIDENGEWIEQASPAGWYRTGDTAVRQTDGSIVVTGRADASVNRRGYLVLLSDIERVMEQLDAISTVVVVAGKEDKQGPRIAAFCVPRPGDSVDGAQLRARCFELLPHYAIPDEIHVTPSLPLLPTGKIDRQQLVALIAYR